MGLRSFIMQIKEIIIKLNIENRSRSFAAVENREFAAFLTYFIGMNFAFSYLMANF